MPPKLREFIQGLTNEEATAVYGWFATNQGSCVDTIAGYVGETHPDLDLIAAGAIEG